MVRWSFNELTKEQICHEEWVRTGLKKEDHQKRKRKIKRKKDNA